jgi:AcrR family transcriptional regulator
MNETKTRILDAAEKILAERGFASCSLREVTAAAAANLGAVNYHFRSKEALIRAVFERRLAPINCRRLAALEECERRSPGRPLPLAKLLHAFLDPLFAPGQDNVAFLRIMGRMYTEPSLDLQQLFRVQMAPTVHRFAAAFRRTLPGLAPEDLFWRLFFTIGAMAHTLAAGPLLKLISDGICDPSDLEDATRRLVHFAGAGLRAAPAPGSDPPRRPGQTALRARRARTDRERRRARGSP